MKQLLLLVLMLLPVVANAYDYDAYIGGIYYKFSGNNATVTSGSPKYSGSVKIPASVTYNSKTYTVTSIGSSAFAYCPGLTSITIPNSVTSIGGSAFAYTGLTSITIPSSVTTIADEAFQNCSGLTSITIPNSVTRIGAEAFYLCWNLTSITIPNSVTSIGGSAFDGTPWYNKQPDGLVYAGKVAYKYKGTMPEGTQITIEDETLGIANRAFRNCTSLTSITIPESVVIIGDDAFRDCSNLTSVTIGNGVTSISESAFYGCSSLASIIIPSSVTTIGNYAFYGCTSLASIIIPNSVTRIGYKAFYGCTSLTSITIPESVTIIANFAFENCTSLTSVNIPNSVKSIGYGNFLGCTSLTSITIPSSVTTIADNAFRDCSGLTSITIPNSVTSIGSYTFYGCCNLTLITIPNSVKSIGSYTFYGCSSLTSITIPNSVTSIGEFAFSDCSTLTTVKVGGATPITISENTFSNQAYATLYVPKGSKAAYATANYWKDFKKIVEYPNPDVNQDDEVDVLDVVDIARFVVGTSSESFLDFLADVNSDGAVNLGDAVCLVNNIAGDQNFVKGWDASSGIDCNDALTLTGKDGCLSLNLENERYYTAFQLDLYVPEGADLIQMLLNAERKQQHQLLYNKVEEGHYRVAALSTSNNEFNGNNGELLNMALIGAENSEVSIRDIKFFDTQGHEYQFEDIEGAITTSINRPTPDPSLYGGEIYNLAGQRLNKMQRGLNIVRGKKIIR